MLEAEYRSTNHSSASLTAANQSAASQTIDPRLTNHGSELRQPELAITNHSAACQTANGPVAKYCHVLTNRNPAPQRLDLAPAYHSPPCPSGYESTANHSVPCPRQNPALPNHNTASTNHIAACSRLNQPLPNLPNPPANRRASELAWTNDRLASHLDVTVSLLWVMTPVISTASVIIVLVAMLTNQWLVTQENMVNPNYNGTGGAQFLAKATVSGLWQLCHTNPGEKTLACNNIDYFPSDDYIPDPNDSTMAIPYTVSRSAGFFIVATVVLLTGELCCLCGHISRQRRLLTFIAGLSFIISGLFMLIGLVMYISVLKAEIGGKLRPRSLLQPPMFTFRYGYSFVLYVTGFIITEVAGTCAVFLYIYWHQREWMHKQLGLRRKLSGSLYLDSGLVPLCRRHPQLYISNTNMRLSPPLPARFSPILQRRLYLDRGAGDCSDNDSSPTCHRHGKTVAEDVPLPPEAYLYQNLPLNGFPRDATTNTVSTAADDDDYSPSLSHDHDFVPFDLDNVPVIPQCRPECPLRKTTPV